MRVGTDLNSVEEAQAEQGAPDSAIAVGRVGFLTTWNQRCGLATYANFLLSQLPAEHVTILAEETSELSGTDGSNVIRCWARKSSDSNRISIEQNSYQEIEEIVRRQQIQLLHINCQARFFHYPSFSELLSRLRASGVRTVAHLHSLFTVDDDVRSLVCAVDHVIVHSKENRLEAIAQGAEPGRVSVLAHGVLSYEPQHAETKASLRKRLGIRWENDPLIATFGFIQPHKGIEGLLESVIHLKSRGMPARGLVVGEVMREDPNSRAYLDALKQLVAQHGIENDIQFVSKYVPDEEVGEYLAAADLVMMNYRSQYFEASGACSLAVGAGSVVMASLAPPMMAFGDAVWHMTGGYPPALSAELLLSNSVLRHEVQERARSYAVTNSWSVTAERIQEIYRTLGFRIGANAMLENLTVKERAVNQPMNRSQSRKRILMQNRPGTFTQRGGDTVVVEKLSSGLQARGFDVTIDVTGTADPGNYDLVHLFNFATADLTRALAERAHARGVPFVVTTLCEDISSFHNQSHALSNRLIDYVANGQDKEWWGAHPIDLALVPKCAKFACDWIAQNAAALLSNGKTESEVLRRNYSSIKCIYEVPLGHEIGASCGPEMFIQEYGVRDFILCVGRIETRKNQLMLLKALEDSDIPVVLAGGGFSYQPEYEAAVRKFKRRGKTIILGKVSPEMLSSAYAACRMHVLPSWYELPGLVSLEAGAHGKNVVATRLGTSSDYLKDKAYYCSPSDIDSILCAVTAAYYAPLMPGLRELSSEYTWDRSVSTLIDVYERIIPAAVVAPTVRQGADAVPAAMYDMSADMTEFQDVLEQGEMAAKRMDFEVAHSLLERAEQIDPSSVRALKARGAVYLAESKVDTARDYFDRALKLSPNDPKVLSGRGMCDVVSSRHAEAVEYFKRALAIAPDHLVALHQLIDCSYKLNSFGELSQSLNRYLTIKPSDIEMRFCLAGCYYAMERMGDAQGEVSRILSENPNHSAAMELREKIVQALSATRKSVTMPNAPQVEQAKTPMFGGSLQDSLQDLSKRMTEWRVGNELAPKETKVVLESHTELPPIRLNGPEGAVPQYEAKIPSAEIPQPVSEVQSRIFEIDELKREKNFEEAQNKLKALLANPMLKGAELAKAKCLEAELMVVQGDLVGADMLYDIILRENAELPRALVGKGALAAEEQRWSSAEAYFDRALARDDGYDVALAGKGLCAMAADRNTQAFEYFYRAASKNPENSRAVLGVLQLGYPLQRLSEIETVLRSYLDLHPGNIDMLYSLAGALFAQKRQSEAMSELEKILLFEPANPRALELKRMITGEDYGAEAR